MTRYIGEPSPEKKLAEGRALTESLARRPAPPTPPPPTGALTLDRAYLFFDASFSLPDQNTTNLTGYSTATAGTNILANTTTGKFTLTARGIYLAQAVGFFTNSFAGGKMIRIAQGGTGTVLQDTLHHTNWISERDLGTSVDMVMVEALIFLVNPFDPTLDLQVKVRQTSGAAQTFSSCDFSVVRLGDY